MLQCLLLLLLLCCSRLTFSRGGALTIHIFYCESYLSRHNDCEQEVEEIMFLAHVTLACLEEIIFIRVKSRGDCSL